MRKSVEESRGESRVYRDKCTRRYDIVRGEINFRRRERAETRLYLTNYTPTPTTKPLYTIGTPSVHASYPFRVTLFSATKG